MITSLLLVFNLIFPLFLLFVVLFSYAKWSQNEKIWYPSRCKTELLELVRSLIQGLLLHAGFCFIETVVVLLKKITAACMCNSKRK